MFHKHQFKYNEDKTAIWCECGKVVNFKEKRHECEMKELFAKEIGFFNHTLQKDMNQEVKYFGCSCGKMKIVNVTTGMILEDNF